MKDVKNAVKLVFAIIMFGVSIVSIENEIVTVIEQNKYLNMEITESCFRNNFYSTNQIENKQQYSDECKHLLENVENEVSYFPVAESTVDKTLKTNYINSWMAERTFGGERRHEGIDVMASKNVRGLYPVVSMTDGIVTNLGWLEQGGYRVGITSDSGIYYYYAHLDSYSNIKEGQRVCAGDFLGYMGDSGYGPEGTTGKFSVHLHVGIYMFKDGREISFNPYYILCHLENKKLKYAYS